jgi:peptide/nickel transport system substrate-binding protein
MIHNMRRIALALLVLIASACEREVPQPPTPAPQPPVSNAPRDGGRLQRRMETDVKTLNYLLHAEEEERQVLAYIFEPLIAFDQNLAPIPNLATKWEVGDGGRSYTLHLDPRATFSDKTPVLASDVVFTIFKALDEESPQFASWFEGLDRAQTKALDAHTVRVVFKEPRVAQLFSFNISVVPEHVYGKGELAKVDAVVGAGPYVFKRHQTGQSVLLERRDDYWREKPHVASILFRVVADESVAWRAFMRGELDVGRINNDTWWREKDKPEVQKKFEFFSVWLLSYNCFVWNLDDPLFADARVRRALAMAFDRRAVIEKIYHGEARPVTGPFTPDQWAHNDEVPPIEFNPDVAKTLLASANWRDSDNDGVLDRDGKKFAFTLLIPAGNVARDQAQILQNALQKIGVKVEIATMDGAAFFDRVMNRNFQAAFFAWVLEPDPDKDLYSLFHSKQKAPEGLNVGGYASAEADELIEQGRVEFDRARRTEIYHQLHDLLARDQPYLWTIQPASKWAVNKRVQNVRVAKGVGLFLWYPGPMAWWLKE